MPLIECVPNFSEGRRPDVISAIADAIASAGAYVLDVSSDPDHNRTVITFAGEPESVLEAVFRGVREASRLIDLREHQGEHPRIGAADVVPFVPLRDMTLDDCADLARKLGQRIGDELNLPVYLYEAAALRPDRVTLPQVRRDPYEKLRETIRSDPTRAPDFGPAELGPAGAVAVGARGFLIAFNAFLDTSDVTVAQEIAVAVRESGGGLPTLRALGLYVNGQAQVTMNVTDFRVTGLYAALDAVRVEAAKRGAAVTHTEIVGLVPQDALARAALDALQLPSSAGDLILERRLGALTGDYRPIIFE